jgi:hypothetical protein
VEGDVMSGISNADAEKIKDAEGGRSTSDTKTNGIKRGKIQRGNNNVNSSTKQESELIIIRV